MGKVEGIIIALPKTMLLAQNSLVFAVGVYFFKVTVSITGRRATVKRQI